MMYTSHPVFSQVGPPITFCVDSPPLLSSAFPPVVALSILATREGNIEKSNTQKQLIKVFGEKFIDPTDTVTFDPEITKETMEIILFHSQPVNSNIAQNIRFYISSEKKIADMPELSLLRKIRRLSKDAKIEFFRALDTITDADKYRNQFNNLGDN